MAKSFQIQISDSEEKKLIDRIETDFRTDKDSHRRWSDRCAGWLKKWENRVSRPAAGEEREPNHTVPLVQWQCFNKLARDMQALLGEDAEITAASRGPSDQAKVAKVGRWMTSRVFDQMEIISPLCEFEFRRILNGWSCAYRPWYRREFDTLVSGRIKRVCDYEGPGFFPMEPDDVMVPPERGVKSIHDFSHIIRRVPVTIDELQRGDGTLFQGTSDKETVKKLIDWAQTAPSNDYAMTGGNDPVREEREKSEGVDYEAYHTGRRNIWVWEWYGYWRPLKKSKDDAEVDDLEKRLNFEADYVVKFIPGFNRIVGVQDLLRLYPKMRRRRPFVESTLIKDGTYRPKGFGALLEDLEDDATANSRLFTKVGELTVGPLIFFRPGGGMRPDVIEYGPNMAIPTEDPAGINVVQLRPNMEYAMAKQQDVFSIAERVTNITDQSLGRSIDRPNAPRTASGQLALIEEGNVRAYLDSTILREDTEKIVTDFWDLDCDMVPQIEPGLFFRVTEEQANGLFDVKQGGAFMTPKEFGGRFDFKLKFATSVWARQQQKGEFFAFFQAAVANPIVMQNPKANWVLLNKLAKLCNFQEWESVIPPPPDLDTPKTPDQEWTEMLEGQEVNVNPQDDDAMHLQQHISQLEDERKDPDRDVQGIKLLVKHVLEHQQQQRTKMLMQAMTTQLMNSITPPAQSPAQQTLAHLAQLYGGQGAQPGMGAMPGAPQPPAGAPGDIPMPPQTAGATGAPKAVDGMM